MNVPRGVALRLAEPDDVVAGAAMHAACWRESYAGIVDPDLLEARVTDPAKWEAGWRQQLAYGPPRTLAVTGEELIGFSVAGSRDGEPTDLHLYAVYTRRAWWGTGVGQALLDAAVGDRSCSLWVLEDNHRARAFYARNGFRPDGSREKYAGLDAWELRLVR